MNKKDVVLDFMSGVQTWTKPMRKIKLIDRSYRYKCNVNTFIYKKKHKLRPDITHNYVMKGL